MIDREERVRNNVAMIVDDNNRFGGTVFFLQKEYCVTCHHNICDMTTINVGRNGKFYDAEWMEEYSDIEKDISVLRVRDSRFEPLECINKILPGLDVIIRGFPADRHVNLPSGKTSSGNLSLSRDQFVFPGRNVSGNNKWNRKPEVNVDVYQFSHPSGQGYSGSPVCYKADWSVVGMYESYDEESGYVIPIELILDKFQEQNRVIGPALPTNFANIIETGNKYFRKEDYDNAISHYDKVLYDPNITFAWINKGKSYNHLEQYFKSIDCFDRALSIDSNNAEAWSNKGYACYNLEKFEQAIDCFDRALSIDSNNAEAWSNKGYALFKLGKWQNALECFDKSTDINPNHIRAWAGRGFTHGKLGNNLESDNSHRKAIEINPEDTTALNSRGQSLMTVNKFEQAIDCFDKVLQINPKNVRALSNKGHALWYLGKYEEALKPIEVAVSINPKYKFGWQYKYKIHKKLGQMDLASECLFKIKDL